MKNIEALQGVKREELEELINEAIKDGNSIHGGNKLFLEGYIRGLRVALRLVQGA